MRVNFYAANESFLWTSLLAQVVKNLPAMQEAEFQSLGQKIPWRKEWQPTPVFLPGEFHGLREDRQATVHGIAQRQTRLSN